MGAGTGRPLRSSRPAGYGRPLLSAWPLRYFVTMVTVERVQTGFRMERGLLKVLKGLAEYHDLSLGDLIEGIVLHAFEGRSPFGAESLAVVEQLKTVYGVTLTAADAHRLEERS